MRVKTIASLIVLAAVQAALAADSHGAKELNPGAKPAPSADSAKEPSASPAKEPSANPPSQAPDGGPSPEGSTPEAGQPAAGGASSEASAVVEQILKDKEDLITGKRFIYDPAGRRDPFRSLLEQVSRFKGPRPKGIKGMLISEADLVGTVRDPRGNIAFFKGSDNKGYFLRVGDELYDGRIIAVDPDTGMVTFRQQVDDPRQIKPYRDIVKRVSPLVEEEAQ